MIQLFPYWFKSGFDFTKIHHPAAALTHLPADNQTHLKRMTMQSCTFVSHRYIGQSMCSFKIEFFINFHRWFAG